jgi:rubredoxin-NAD+ reductase
MNYRKWECAACGHIYDEAIGAPDDGIPPGTRWEQLPADWTCPECGASRDDFVLIADGK